MGRRAGQPEVTSLPGVDELQDLQGLIPVSNKATQFKGHQRKDAFSATFAAQFSFYCTYKRIRGSAVVTGSTAEEYSQRFRGYKMAAKNTSALGWSSATVTQAQRETGTVRHSTAI